MKWKDILIGAISTLAITVIGGIIIYYVTKEPELKSKEMLTFSTRSSGHFNGNKEQVAFTSIDVYNRGGRAASNVSVNIQFNDQTIKDISVDSLPGANETRKVTEKSAILTYTKLLPGESVTVNLLLSGPAKPKVQVRSDDSLAIFEVQPTLQAPTKKSILNNASSYVVPISALLFSILAANFFRRLRRAGMPEFADKNNAGFLLLHNGLVNEAHEIFNDAIKGGHYNSYMLSNMALCKALMGDMVKSEALLSAAKFRDKIGHAGAVIAFNEAVIHFLTDNKTLAIACLKTAISASPKEVKLYYKRSVHLDKYRLDVEQSGILADA